MATHENGLLVRQTSMAKVKHGETECLQKAVKPWCFAAKLIVAGETDTYGTGGLMKLMINQELHSYSLP